MPEFRPIMSAAASALAHPDALGAIGVAYAGTAANDTQGGTAGDDFFEFQQGGDDSLNGGSGNDRFDLGSAFTANDAIVGGAGFDTLTLDGDYYLNQIHFRPGTMSGVEAIEVAAGNDYVLTLDDANVATGEVLDIDAGLLGKRDFLQIFADAETDGAFSISGGRSGDGIYLGQSNDTVMSGAGDDLILQKAPLTSTSRVNGGAGSDSYSAEIAASGTVVLDPASLVNIESFAVVAQAGAGDLILHLVLDDANLAPGAILRVAAGGTTGATLTLSFDGSAETRGAFDIFTTQGDDTIVGGSGGDTIRLEQGADWIRGGAGADVFLVDQLIGSPRLTTADRIDGGRGADTLQLLGQMSVAFEAATLTGVETIRLLANGHYVLSTDDANVARKTTLTIDGSAMAATDSLSFDGSSETDGGFVVNGGSGADDLIGGSRKDVLLGRGGDDHIVGGGGADRLAGSNGHDTFAYVQLSDSRGVAVDLITDFVYGADLIDLHLIDADAGSAGDQAFHLGKTAGHAGDVAVSYDAADDLTIVRLYVDSNNTVDGEIWLEGHQQLLAADFAL